jgi:hypothetical protein
MARAKQYADRANVIKRIKLGSKWPFAPVVEHKGRIVRDLSGPQGGTSTIPRVDITSSGMKREYAGGSRFQGSRICCRLLAQNQSN